MQRRSLSTLVVSGASGSGRVVGSLPFSAAAHAAVITAALVLPLFGQPELPPVVDRTPVGCWEPPVVALPAGTRANGSRQPGSRPADAAPPIRSVRFAAPLGEPQELHPEDFSGPGVPDLDGGAGRSGIPGGLIDAAGIGSPEPPGETSAEPVHVGGRIAPPVKLRHVDPAYPPIARIAGVQGIVILECTISEQGRVVGVRVLRGVPLLDAAAIAAVEQWVYSPTLLNGRPVAVVMSVTVHFRLS